MNFCCCDNTGKFYEKIIHNKFLVWFNLIFLFKIKYSKNFRIFKIQKEIKTIIQNFCFYQ